MRKILTENNGEETFCQEQKGREKMANEEVKMRWGGGRVLLALFAVLAAMFLFAAPARADDGTELTADYLSSHTLLDAGSYYLNADVTTTRLTLNGDATIKLNEFTLTVTELNITRGKTLTLTGTGTLGGSITSYNGTLAGGEATISGTVNNTMSGKIQSGTYTGSVNNNGNIKGGTFSGNVTNDDLISGGTFTTSSTVTNHYAINGGTFYGTFTNYGTIHSNSGITFYGTVTNESGGTINGGEFYKAVQNESGGKITSGEFYDGIDNHGGTVDESAYLTVTFDTQGGSAVASQTVLGGQDATRPANPTRMGYTFDNWYYDGKPADFKKISYNYTFVAHWTAISYSISYDLDGGSLPEGTNNPTSYTAESDVIILNNPHRDGYAFVGWTGTDLSDATETVTIHRESTGDRSYTANWTANKYTVTFNAIGGTVTPDSTEVTYDSTYGELPTPSWSGYTFDGWFTAIEGGNKVESTTEVSITDNQTLYAHWTKDSAQWFTVSYSWSGAENLSVMLPADDNHYLGEDAAKAAVDTTYTSSSTATGTDGRSYTFSGWTSNTEGQVVKFSGTWTRKSSPVIVTPSTPTNPTVTIPVSSDHGAVNVTATVSGSTADIEVSDRQIERVIADHAGMVTIDLSGLPNVNTVNIPAHVVKKTHTAEDTGLTVAFSKGSVSFDETALESVNTGKTVKVSLQSVSASSLSSSEKNAINYKAAISTAVDVSVSVGGVSQDSFGEGNLTISVPYTPKSGEDTDRLAVWFIRDDRRIRNHAGKYDADKKEFTFDTEHLSRFIIVNVPDTGKHFSDVKKSSYYFWAADWASRNEITSGTSDTTFSPDGSCTRAQMVTFLWRAAGSPEVDEENPFHDVSEEAYYADAVKWAVKNGITSGTSKTTFSPDDNCIREQFVTFLYRYAKCIKMDVSAGEDTNILSYADADKISAYAFAPFQWAVGSGFVSGYGDGILGPQDDCTRAQGIAILYRMLGE